MTKIGFPIAIAIAALCGAPAFAATPVTGNWVTQDGDAVVTISKCGASYCGRISRFIVAPPDGLDQRDINNPDKAKRKRKLLGLPVLYSFREDDDVWRGRIYDPKTGKSYRSVLERQNATTLKVKGCIGPFCQTQRWKRAQ